MVTKDICIRKRERQKIRNKKFLRVNNNKEKSFKQKSCLIYLYFVKYMYSKVINSLKMLMNEGA